MAFVRSSNLANVILQTSGIERTFDHPSIHPDVTAMYMEKEYHKRPKSAQEAEERCIKGFNGMSVTAQELQTTSSEDGEVLTIKAEPTRYLVRDAMADCVKEHNIVDHDILGIMSPRILGVSIIAPAKIHGVYCIVGQVKGNALGSGEIHFGFVAGGVRADDLNAENPLLAALKHQVKDESGLNRDELSLSNFKYFFDERETGQVNIAAVARHFDYDYALVRFEQDTIKKIADKKKLEVNGFAPIPVAGLVIVPIEKGAAGLAKAECYLATAEGLVRKVEDRGVRPYSVAFINHLAADRRNLNQFLQYAGF